MATWAQSTWGSGGWGARGRKQFAQPSRPHSGGASLAGAQDVPASCLLSPGSEGSEWSSHSNRRAFKDSQQTRALGRPPRPGKRQRGASEGTWREIQKDDRLQDRGSKRFQSRPFPLRFTPSGQLWGSRVYPMRTCFPLSFFFQQKTLLESQGVKSQPAKGP